MKGVRNQSGTDGMLGVGGGGWGTPGTTRAPMIRSRRALGIEGLGKALGINRTPDARRAPGTDGTPEAGQEDARNRWDAGGRPGGRQEL